MYYHPAAFLSATALFTAWITRFGVPSHITSDGGPQFTSSLWSSLTALFNITSGSPIVEVKNQRSPDCGEKVYPLRLPGWTNPPSIWAWFYPTLLRYTLIVLCDSRIWLRGLKGCHSVESTFLY